MEPLTFTGVPIDSVGRSGGTEHGPGALRDLGLPAARAGARDALGAACLPATDYLLPSGMDWEELRAAIRPFLASEALAGASLGC